LGALREAFARGEDVGNAARFARAGAALRPSIETAMHALIPAPVVLHVHCVATIAAAVRADAATILARALHGLNFAFLPYARPGQPLAEVVAARPGFDIYVLGNHGLTVAAETVPAAMALLDTVAARLDVAPRATPGADVKRLAALAAGTEYLPATDPALHALAADPASLAVARAGSLYPDHVIFLGPGVAEWPETKAPFALVPGAGALVRRDASASALAMMGCLADVAARVPSGAALAALDRDEDAGLLGWEAETYRQGLKR
ncbi:MAG TPA: class II aldolase/adducin family protein, partial [Acidiphilium sp.]